MIALPKVIVSNKSFFLITVMCTVSIVGISIPSSVEARPLHFGRCAGSQAVVGADWPGIAEGTVGVCGTLVYHSTAVGIYGNDAETQLFRPQV